MMQTTDFEDLQYRARLRPLDGPPVWRILLKRQVSPGAVIVRNVPAQDAAQVPFIQDEDVVETLASD